MYFIVGIQKKNTILQWNKSNAYSVKRAKQRRIILGGDFNPQFGVGTRGASFYEFQNSSALKVANEREDPWEKQWTLRSSLGATRKIDFIFVSFAFYNVACESKFGY